MKFGLIFFASTEKTLEQSKRYELITESAKFADQHDFSSIWVPERHFTAFGCLYPNPAVLHAALATITSKVKLRAGSVVVPLHNPIRIAEEWSMVDNLSGGRVGISFAPGWNPDDFAFFPERYAHRREIMTEGIQTIRDLWQGRTIAAKSGNGRDINIRIYPPPVQTELPIWITAASSPETFRMAGEMGANLLTHTNDQSIPELAEKIAVYRAARADKGFDPASGEVTVLLHTFIGQDLEETLQKVKAPYCNYLKSNTALLKGFASSRGNTLNIDELPEKDLDEFLEFVFERFATERGLIGTPESCLPLVEALAGAGVDELACLLDFGPESSDILRHLPHLNTLKELAGALRPSVEQKTGSFPKPAEKPGPLTAPKKYPDRLEEIRTRCRRSLEPHQFYRDFLPNALQLGPAFRRLEQILQGDREALGLVRKLNDRETIHEQLHFHPAMLDACFQLTACTLPEGSFRNEAYLPAGIQDLWSSGNEYSGPIWAYVRLADYSNSGDQELHAEVRLFEETGAPLLTLGKLTLRKIRLEAAPEEESRAANAYLPKWEPADPVAGEYDIKELLWISIPDKNGVAAAVTRQLRERGGEVIEWAPDPRPDPAAAPSEYREMIRWIENRLGKKKAAKVLFFSSLDAPDEANAAVSDLREYWTLNLSKAKALLGALQEKNGISCWIFTRQAQKTGPADSLGGVIQSPFWGLSRVAAVECPEVFDGIVDIEEMLLSADAPGLLNALPTRSPKQMQLAFRTGKLWNLRLEPFDLPEAGIPTSGPLIDPEALYLVTGGLGGLGGKCAEWLAAKGATAIWLLSRRVSDEALQLCAALEKKGCRVRALPVDVSDRDAMRKVFSDIESGPKPLKGVFHLAGILDDGMIASQPWAEFNRSLEGKSLGAWNLHLLSQSQPLDHFVLFSSLSSLVAQPGQGAYAAANSFLDSLAQYRVQNGQSGLAVNWGPWSAVGHAATDYGRRAHELAAREGMISLDPDQAFQTLEQLLGWTGGQVCIAGIDWKKAIGVNGRLASEPLFSKITGKIRLGSAEPGFPQRLSQLPETERKQEIESTLKKILADILRTGRDKIQLQKSFSQMGLDSLMAIEVRNRIQKELGLGVSVIRLMQSPNMTAFLDDLLAMANTAPGGGDNAQNEEPQHCAVPEEELLTRQKILDLDHYSEEELDALIRDFSPEERVNP